MRRCKDLAVRTVSSICSQQDEDLCDQLPDPPASLSHSVTSSTLCMVFKARAQVVGRKPLVDEER